MVCRSTNRMENRLRYRICRTTDHSSPLLLPATLHLQECAFRTVDLANAILHSDNAPLPEARIRDVVRAQIQQCYDAGLQHLQELGALLVALGIAHRILHVFAYVNHGWAKQSGNHISGFGVVCDRRTGQSEYAPCAPITTQRGWERKRRAKGFRVRLGHLSQLHVRDYRLGRYSDDQSVLDNGYFRRCGCVADGSVGEEERE